MAFDREKILQTAQKYVDKKRYDRAIVEYTKIVQQDPNDARTLLKVGDLQARTSAYADAVATYDRVGEYYSAQGFALKAIAVYKQIRELVQKHVPHLAEQYSHILPKLAEIYTQLGLTSDALAAYDEVATRHQRGGRDRDAIEVFRKMVEFDETNPLTHLRLAEACCRVQELDEAVSAFWTAAQLLIELNRRDDALKVIERVLHFRPEAQYAMIAARLYLERGGKPDGLQALAKLQIAFQANPKDLDVFQLLAKAFNAIGQQEKALEVNKELCRLAKEQGKQELFDRVLAYLNQVAPDDEVVRSLNQSQGVTAPAPTPAPEPAPEVELQADSLDYEDIEEYEEPRYDQQPYRPQTHSGPDVEVVDEGLDAAEELPSPDSFDPGAHARKAIVDAESFRNLRLYPRALETLRVALEIDPRNLELREELRDIYWESGDQDSCVAEMVTLAALFMDLSDFENADIQLRSLLQISPDHPTASEMLEQLAGMVEGDPGDPRAEMPTTSGYDDADLLEVVDDYAPAKEAQPYAPAAEPVDYGDPNQPLPSYDLEEVSASSALASAPPQSHPDSAEFDAVDDPFGDAPLPSFPLASPEEDLMEGLDPNSEEFPTAPEDFEPPAPAVLEPAADTLELVPESLDWEEPAAPSAQAPAEAQAPAPVDSQVVEEVLDEADFFAARGLVDDACMVIEDQLSRTPNHPLLVERLEELRQATTESGTRERSEFEPAPVSGPEDRAFDIAASLDALDDLGAPEQPAANPAFSSNADEVDVDQVFAKFKEGVRSQVAESDSSTHYDLGVAYKEMGLLPDAIQEFEVAGRDPTRECTCHAMIGMIHLETGDTNAAADAYIRGLSAQKKTVDQEMSLYYDLGTVYEVKESPAEALYYFDKIARRDPGYRDIAERIEYLRPAGAAPTAKAVGDDDEFDQVFDDLFESK